MTEPTHYDDGLNQHISRPGGDDQPKNMSAQQSAAYWTEQLSISEREHKDWIKEADEVMHVYRTAEKRKRKGSNKRRNNILYANTETMRSSIFGKPGKPHVATMWQTQDAEVAKGAEMLQRALTCSVNDVDYFDIMEAAVLDSVLTNRAVLWLEYEPEIEPVQMQDPFTGETVVEEQITNQKVRKVLLDRHEFRHSPAKRWEDNWWVARRHLMTRDDLKDNEFNNATEVPLQWNPNDDTDHTKKEDDNVRRAEVWEIWSKPHKKRFFVVPGYTEILREDDDPYELDKFWPMSRPLNLTPLVDTMIPSIEWNQYSRLADDLEDITERIANLTNAMRRRGIYDSSIKELKRLAKAQDNEFIPVERYEQLAQKGGLQQAFQVEDLQTYVAALSELYRSQAETEARIDKLSGIADVMRGNVDADEKLGQTQLKAQFGGLRIKTRQRRVQRFIVETQRVEAELILTFFEPEVLAQMTQIDVSPELLEMLRDDRMRSYLVDIETDSTVFEDAESEKAAVSEAVQATTSLMQTAIPLLQTEPEMANLTFELIGAIVRTIKGGRTIEEAVDKAREERMQRMQQMQQQQEENPEPDPMQQQMEMQMQMEQVKAQQAQEQAQAKMQLEQLKLQAAQSQADIQTRMDEIKMQDAMQQSEMKQILAEMQMEHEKAKHAMEMERDVSKYEIDLEKMAFQAEMAKKQNEYKQKSNGKGND